MPDAAAVYAFLRGETTPAAARVRAAVLAPGTDQQADRALAEFRSGHLHPHRSADAVAATREALNDARQADQIARLVVTCQRSFRPAATARTAADTKVSTAVSTHVESSAEQRRRNRDDPRQLWPLLLELTAVRMKKPLTVKLAVGDEFADGLTESLVTAFRAAGDRHRILRGVLSGQTFRTVGKGVNEPAELVEAFVGSLHAELSRLLGA